MAIKKPHVSYLPQMGREIPTDALSLKSGFVGFVEFRVCWVCWAIGFVKTLMKEQRQG